MINVLRKHSQWLMLFITILVIISFVWLYNSTQFEKIGSGTVATIYDRNLAREDYQRYERQAQLAQNLGLTDLLNFGYSQRGFSAEAFTVNLIVLEHEVEALGIAATQEEIFRTVQGLPPFQTNGAFDATKYQQFITTALPPLGLTDAEIEKLVRLQLSIGKLRALVASTAPASPTQFRQLYTAQFQKVTASFIRYRLADFQAAVKLTDADLKKAYEERKASLESEEQRSVQYVIFGLTDDEKKLTDKTRTDALQKIANQAQAFSQALLEKGTTFEQAATKVGAKVLLTSNFTAAKPAAALADVPGAGEAAFALTKEEPNSDILQTPSAFYVLHLDGIEPAKPLTFEQAKATLTTELTNERAQAQLSAKGAEDHAKLEAALKKNPNFVQAATSLGLKAETAQPFSIAEPPMDETVLTGSMVNKSVTLAAGQTSAFTPAADGGFILHVEKRDPIADATYAKESAKLLPNYQQSQQNMVFDDWLGTQIKAANYQPRTHS